MRSVFICGTGRCGTSALASVFEIEQYSAHYDEYPSGTFIGAYPPYEVPAINDLNDKILHYSGVQALGVIAAQSWAQLYSERQLWLQPWPEHMPALMTNEQEARLASLLPTAKPFCIKDPRLSVVADLWIRYAPDALLIAAFRSCNKTIDSLRVAHRDNPWLQRIPFDAARCRLLWRATYRRILMRYRSGQPTLFVKYESLWSENWRSHLANDVILAPLRFSAIDDKLRKPEFSSRNIEESKLYSILNELDTARELRYESLPVNLRNMLDASLAEP